MIKAIFFIVFIIFCDLTIGQNYNNQISVDVKYQALKKGKLFTIENTTFYDGRKEDVICYYHTPTEFYKSINAKGEITIYMPRENTVSFTHNSHYSSKNELIYYFVSNKTEDLGLRNEGFTIKDSKYEGNNLIVTWESPVTITTVKEVDIVYENMVPIYSEYRDIKDKVIKKTYYYEYYLGSFFSLPQKITEISYTSENDSVIKRTSISNIKLGSAVDERKFKFDIPADATYID
ncbi:hypothetical protein [Saccharicrinis fermentans]|uniref:Outer membrane lipoprotein-sorting protein n=1 Tax=Saccharicrinis fermentans DSM 9555 = JCM 21142 TaxID=869213 RepID=W7YEJ9_9BACT|nr:hypothetical protein [Saccharicrinis fermentans]GAF05898.1 hypothetical protein JCM21142_124657 [Saccharicrinis fermentans DSM 9555 = JCM 21142]